MILNVVCRFYYYIPWNEPSTTGATDFCFPDNFRGYNGSEGFAAIRLDENGFNNPSVPEAIDILCMGSSHSLGYCVEPGESWPELLAQELEGTTTYNISIFSHGLVNCLGNLEAALETYQPTQNVVIEFPNAMLEYDQLCALNVGSIREIDEVTGTFSKFIKQFPYLQLAGHQIKNLLTKDGVSSSTVPAVDMADYTAQLDLALENARIQTQEYGCGLILLYHHSFSLDSDGMPIAESSEYLDLLAEACEKHGILLLDTQDALQEDYLRNHRLHYGFSNTTPGSGHLNRYGNLVLAAELASVLKAQ